MNSPLPADLLELKAQFDHWRSIRPYIRQPIPAELRPAEFLAPSSARIHSPYDTQARFASKRSTQWLGYKVHLTETYGEETPNIITNVQTEEATVNDNYSLPEIHERLSKSELLLDKHLVDGGYIEASNLVESRREYDIDLIGPAQNNGRSPASAGEWF